MPRIHRGGGRILLALVLLGMIPYLAFIWSACSVRSRPPSARILCAANLHGCGKSLMIYASQYQGSLPPDIDTLVRQGLVQPAQLLCPATPPPADFDREAVASISTRQISPRLHEILGSCYVYIPGQKAPADPADVLMYEKNGCHSGDGGNVLFGDYRVEWVEPYSKVEQLVARTRQRLAQATQPASRPAVRPSTRAPG